MLCLGSKDDLEEGVVLVVGLGVELDAKHLLAKFQRLDRAVVRAAGDARFGLLYVIPLVVYLLWAGFYVGSKKNKR